MADENTNVPPAARWQSEEDNRKGKGVTWSDVNPGAQKVDLELNSVLQNAAPKHLCSRLNVTLQELVGPCETAARQLRHKSIQQLPDTRAGFDSR